MAELTYFPEVQCEVTVGGLLPRGVTARVADVEGRHQFVQVTSGMINRWSDRDYLPVGIVEIDRKKRRVLIELPAEADSGAHRLWVRFDDLRKQATEEAEAVA
jgi:hypothetical protein